jgi:hypothetical protein
MAQYEMVITVDDRADVEDVLAVLSEAEENGELGFAFGVVTNELNARELERRVNTNAFRTGANRVSR